MESQLQEVAAAVVHQEKPYKKRASKPKQLKPSHLRRRKPPGRRKHLSRFCSNRSLSTPTKHEISNSRARYCFAFFSRLPASPECLKLLEGSAMDLMKARFTPHNKFVLSQRYATASPRIRRRPYTFFLNWLISEIRRGIMRYLNYKS